MHRAILDVLAVGLLPGPGATTVAVENAAVSGFTFSLEAVGDSTRLRVEVGGHGVIGEGVPAVVERVWRHFLFERLQPYLREELGQ